MAATGWWFILWLWAPIYGAVLSEEFFQPIWATLGYTGTFFVSDTGKFVVTLITIALAGVLVSPSTFLYPNSMDAIFVFGFTAAVIGGLDSPVGAVVGGLLLGIALSYVAGYLGSKGSDLTSLVALGILVVVLMIRPDGLFSATKVRRV